MGLYTQLLDLLQLAMRASTAFPTTVKEMKALVKVSHIKLLDSPLPQLDLKYQVSVERNFRSCWSSTFVYCHSDDLLSLPAVSGHRL